MAVVVFWAPLSSCRGCGSLPLALPAAVGGRYNVRASIELRARGFLMEQGSDLLTSTRRDFLVTTSGALAGAMANSRSRAEVALQPEGQDTTQAKPRRKIPIGVFDPAFPDLTLDQLVEKYASLGVEAAEIGTGGYPRNQHCPAQKLLDDPAKLNAWRKKFEDHNIQIATLSCHGNPVHPDRTIAERDDQSF